MSPHEKTLQHLKKEVLVALKDLKDDGERVTVINLLNAANYAFHELEDNSGELVLSTEDKKQITKKYNKENGTQCDFNEALSQIYVQICEEIVAAEATTPPAINTNLLNYSVVEHITDMDGEAFGILIELEAIIKQEVSDAFAKVKKSKEPLDDDALDNLYCFYIVPALENSGLLEETDEDILTHINDKLRTPEEYSAYDVAETIYHKLCDRLLKKKQ